MPLLNFAIVCLATWRISNLVAYESGPAGIFKRFRAWLKTDEAADGSIAELFSCVWCLSIWLGIALAVPFFGLKGIPIGIAASAVASIIDDVRRWVWDEENQPPPPPAALDE